MIALHVSVLDGTPMLWSEGSTLGNLVELRLALHGIGISFAFSKNTTEELVAWLPCRGKEPLPSSSLLGDEPDKRRKESLQPFLITALSLDINSLQELAYLAEKGNVPTTGVIFAHSMQWIRQVLQSALNLVASQLYLPSVILHNGVREARWIPVPDSAALIVLKKIAESMPPVCRSISRTDTLPPEEARSSVLKKLLSSLVDIIVRDSSELTGTLSGTRFESIHAAWLQALLSTHPQIVWDKVRDIEELGRQLTLWRRPIEVLDSSPNINLRKP